MKKNRLIVVACFVVAGLLVTGCGLSKEDLAKEVKLSIEETWAEQGIEGIEIKDFTLIKRGENDYRGVLKVEADGEIGILTVNVSVDGDTFIWEIED
jgi:hypothetical protein